MTDGLWWFLVFLLSQPVVAVIWGRFCAVGNCEAVPPIFAGPFGRWFGAYLVAAVAVLRFFA